jgi:hypothetical protein
MSPVEKEPGRRGLQPSHPDRKWERLLGSGFRGGCHGRLARPCSSRYAMQDIGGRAPGRLPGEWRPITMPSSHLSAQTGPLTDQSGHLTDQPSDLPDESGHPPDESRHPPDESGHLLDESAHLPH